MGQLSAIDTDGTKTGIVWLGWPGHGQARAELTVQNLASGAHATVRLDRRAATELMTQLGLFLATS